MQTLDTNMETLCLVTEAKDMAHMKWICRQETLQISALEVRLKPFLLLILCELR